MLFEWELWKLGTSHMHALRTCCFILFCLFVSSTTRNLAEIFMVLPTRKELPDYYQIIKHPVDIRKIRVRLLCFILLLRGSPSSFFLLLFRSELGHVHDFVADLKIVACLLKEFVIKFNSLFTL